MEKFFTIVALLIFGPIILGAMAQAAWPGISAFFTSVFWFLVLVGATSAAFVFLKKYSEYAKEEDQQRRERQELDVLYQRVIGEHKRIWGEEHDFDRTITEHQRALDEKFYAIVGSRNLGRETP